MVSLRIESSLHVGTDLDGPKHMADGGGDMASLPLTTLVHEGAIVAAGSADHPMNTTIRHMRPDLTRRFEQKVGMPVRDYYGEYTYTHHRSGRAITEQLFPSTTSPSRKAVSMPRTWAAHRQSAQPAMHHRCLPWKFEGGEACPCRIIAFFDVGDLTVEEMSQTL